jgi:hypothetical protein
LGHAADLAGKACALLAALFLIAAPAHAACVDPGSLRVEYGSMAFTQTRHLSGVRAPLVSRGQVTVARERVDWHVAQPLNIRTTITPAGITQSIDNAPPERITPQGGSDAFFSSAGLMDLLAGNLSALDAHYVVARGAPKADGSWSMRLTPRAQGLARFVSHIEVAGCERIRSVELRQANGDRMVIALAPGP